jgi:hypothetical protein
MKKIVVVLVVALFVISVLSSCKSKDCPAYSYAKTEQANNA